MMTGKNDTASRGNVLFLILIAVALFAALSYAVTSSTRSGGGNADKEKGAMNDAWLQNYGTSIANSFLRLRMSRGITADEVCFYAPSNSVYSNTATQPNNLFHPQGGGAIFQGVPDNMKGDYGTAQGFLKAEMPHIGTTTGTAASTDIVFVVGGISKAACEAVNARMNNPLYQYVMGMGTSPLTAGNPAGCVSNIAGTAFGGAVSPTTYPGLAGKLEGCTEDSMAPGMVFYYYRVILER